MARLVLHAGMHKTGSTAIQTAFAAGSDPAARYVDWITSNHSSLFALLTHDAPEPTPLLRRMGLASGDLQHRRAAALRDFRQVLASLTGTGIFSAEEMFSATRPQLERFHDILSGFGHDIDVLMYVRPPVSFAESAFQQRLKGGRPHLLDPDRLIPDYRHAIENLDVVFGRSRVELRPYHPWEFPDGDVVRDFAGYVGTEPPAGRPIRKNASLSAQATALLYLYRCAVVDTPAARRPAPPALLSSLRRIQGSKLRFSSRLIGPALEQNRAMLDWLAVRMGVNLQDRHDPAAIPIGGHDDLVDMALEQEDALRDILMRQIDAPGQDSRARCIALLRALHGPA